MTDAPGDEIPGEPTGTTIDGTPWEEARPPHLPDTVTGLPVPTMLFTLGAIVIGILTIQDRLPDVPSDAGGTLLWVLSLTIPIVKFLIPAVFFLRHRDAWSAHRAMAIGTSLLALGPVLNLASRYLGDWFDSILPPPEDQPWLNPFSIAMQVAISAIAILAIVYMARGLVEARQYEDRPGMRRWWVLVVVVALVGSGLGLAVFGAISSDVEESTFVASYLLSLLSIAINAVTVYAWAYFTGTAIAGRRAGEDPNLGWFLAAFAGACILALFLGSGVQSMLAYLMQVNISTDVSVVLSVLPEIAYLALLAAFALRLPTTHAPVDDVEDEAGADGVPGSGDPATAIAAPDDLAGSTA